MKRLLFVISILQVSFLHAQWRTVFRNADSINNIVGASFYSKDAGFVATDKWIGFTTDSGMSFDHRVVSRENTTTGRVQVNPFLGFSPLQVHAFSKDTLFVSGSFGNDPSILYSMDNGLHWELVYHQQDTSVLSSGNAVYRISMPQNGNTGFAVQSNEIIKTTDKGKTWQSSFQGANLGLFTIGFIDARIGYAAGPNILLKTIDGGSNWSVIGGITSTIQAISVIDDQRLAVLSSREDSYFLRFSLNGGDSWQEEHAFPKISGPVVLNDIQFTDDSVGYACGTAVYKTRNGGKDWQLMPGSESGANPGGYLSMLLLDKKQAWVTGPLGLLKRNGQGGFLALHSPSNIILCKDSSYTLRWTSHETGPLNLFYSTDEGEHFLKLASSIPATDSSFSTRMGIDKMKGSPIIFKITDEDSSLIDSAIVRLSGGVVPSVLITGNKTGDFHRGEYEFRAFTSNAGEATSFQWFVNGSAVEGTDSVITLGRLQHNDQVQVKMTAGIGCFSASNSISVKDGIAENNLNFTLYPNPAISMVNISSLRQEDGWQSVDVVDAHGQLKIPPQSVNNKSSISLRVAGLPKGVYFVRLLNQSRQVKTIQFVKL